MKKKRSVPFRRSGRVNLMAAYIVMREADLEQIIPISNAVYDLSPAVRKVDLLPDQHWPVKDLLSAMRGAGRGGRGGTTGGAKDDTAAHIPIYSTQDWQGTQREQSFFGRYASWIIIDATALLTIVVPLIAHILPAKIR